ncbi:uncharacterized protein LOC125681503 [Ostrea edulis]|uniref:uncharacterized protein LOC125681503 n=1 Tax=Ostrea edulis TaxID=37623 RepID=UPI0024AFF3FA|nr:uncharacterized protein LOC125681503 [Ostrea edulis]
MFSMLNSWLILCGYFHLNGALGTQLISVFEYRRRCPNSKENWQERSERYFCNAPAQYHCMLKEDGNLVEFCADIIWVEEDYCPVYNVKIRSIDVSLCPENADCPRGHYLSNTVYKYPDCLQRKQHSTTTTPNTASKTLERIGGSYGKLQNSRNTGEVVNSVVLVLVLICMICSVSSFGILLVFVRKTNVKACRPYEDEKTEKAWSGHGVLYI